MIQLTEDLYMDADDHCYIVGKPRKSRGNGTELRNQEFIEQYYEKFVTE